MDDKELAAALPDEPRTPGPHTAVVVGSGPIDAVLDELLLHFEKHPDDELRVQRAGATVGYLDADTLYHLLAPPTRDVGNADHFALLGDPRDEPLVLDCPLGDYSLEVVLYPAAEPPRCPNHPDRELQVRS